MEKFAKKNDIHILKIEMIESEAIFNIISKFGYEQDYYSTTTKDNKLFCYYIKYI